MKQKELSEMSLEELWELFPIVLKEHNENWIDWYQEEREILCKVLERIDVLQIYHIGSTAIEGIWAKPTVDILVELRNQDERGKVEALLLANGYLCMSKDETRMVFNKGYTKSGFAQKVFHIHIRLAGDNDELYFRDYMNDKPVLAREYEKLKLTLWKKYEHNRDGYTNAKTEFIEKYTEDAKERYGVRYE